MRIKCKCESLEEDVNYSRKNKAHSEEFDAIYCTICFEWLESVCWNPDICEFCFKRPENAKGLDANSKRPEED